MLSESIVALLGIFRLWEHCQRDCVAFQPRFLPIFYYKKFQIFQKVEKILQWIPEYSTINTFLYTSFFMYLSLHLSINLSCFLIHFKSQALIHFVNISVWISIFVLGFFLRGKIYIQWKNINLKGAFAEFWQMHTPG